MVFLSFYAVTGNLATIGQSPNAVVGLVAGIPLGFLLRLLYWQIIHRWMCEQYRMGKEECKIVADRVQTQYIDKFVKRVPEGDRTRTISHVLMFALSEDKNASYRERIEFHLSNLHALGASIVAVITSLALFWIVKVWFPVGSGFDSGLLPWFVRLSGLWIVVGFIMYVARGAVKESYKVSLAVFATIRSREIEEYIKKAVA